MELGGKKPSPEIEDSIKEATLLEGRLGEAPGEQALWEKREGGGEEVFEGEPGGARTGLRAGKRGGSRADGGRGEGSEKNTR